MNVDTHVLAGAYVCHALDPAESDAFETHLALCETCAMEVDELRATVAALAVAALEPPPFGLHDRVMGQIEVIGQIRTAPVPGWAAPARGPVRRVRGHGHAGGQGRAGASADRPAPRPGDAPPGDAAHRRDRLPRWSPAAALVAGLLALGSVAGYQHHQIATLSGQAPAGGRILQQADARVATGAVQSGGTATVISSQTENEMYFTAADLPALPAGKAYQLWMVDPGGVQPGPVLAPVHGSVSDLVAARLDGVRSVAMTVEPSGGSAQPTSPQILLLALG
ncbi:MAG TPA: anti-sigma factor [Actinocrinis sp.]|nr:anti-sigma factor [Actinocrinis sp.]